AAFYIVGRRVQRRVADAAAQAATADSARLLEDARQRMVLTAKEELMRAREAWDGEVGRRRRDIERREDQIEQKLAGLDTQARELGRREQACQERERTRGAKEAEARIRLAQVAGISAQEANGVDVIIDDTPDTVVVSCFDPVRREVGRLALERLIADGRIHPGRIEEIIGKCRAEIEAGIVEAGEQAVYETGIKGMHPELMKLVGRMRYRTSYGQNILEHSQEVAWLAGRMAAELKLDGQLGKRGALLPHIGKVL